MIYDEIFQIVLENIEEKEIKIDFETEFQQIGITSISFINIIIKVEQKYQIEFPDEKLLLSEAGTIKKIGDIVTMVLSKNIQ